MNEIEKYNYENVYMLGDIHGAFKRTKNNINNLPDNSLIIQVGDFGVGFNVYNERNDFPKLNLKLAEKNSHLLAIRGNHDDPSYFNGDTFKKLKEELGLTRIELLEDYSVINVNGEHVLCIGGAISIDRIHRITGVSYWSDEKYNHDLEKLKEIDINSVSCVITHTAPQNCFPVGFNKIVEHYILMDGALEYELLKEREEMQELFDFLKKESKVKNWYYGHFHSSNTETIEDVKMQLLGIDEFKLHNNNG
jgi:predicted phosphodiesterase